MCQPLKETGKSKERKSYPRLASDQQRSVSVRAWDKVGVFTLPALSRADFRKFKTDDLIVRTSEREYG